MTEWKTLRKKDPMSNHFARDQQTGFHFMIRSSYNKVHVAQHYMIFTQTTFNKKTRFIGGDEPPADGSYASDDYVPGVALLSDDEDPKPGRPAREMNLFLLPCQCPNLNTLKKFIFNRLSVHASTDSICSISLQSSRQMNSRLLTIPCWR